MSIEEEEEEKEEEEEGEMEGKRYMITKRESC